MRKISIIIVLLAFMFIFTGCVGEGTVVNREIVLEGVIKTVDVDSETANVVVHKSTDGIQKVVVGETDLTKFNVTLLDGVLKIEEERKSALVIFSISNKEVALYLVDDAYSFDIDTTSGRVIVDELTEIEELDIEITSGKLQHNNTKVKGNYSIDITSGSTNIENVEISGTLSIDSTSGSINLINIIADDIKVENTSGTVNFQSLSSKNVEIDSTSGSVNVELTNSTVEKIDIESSSGSIKIYIPEDIAGFTVTKNITSGSYKCDFSDDNPVSYKDGSTKINLEVKSGSVHIYKR